jgi:hypothetical protein
MKNVVFWDVTLFVVRTDVSEERIASIFMVKCELQSLATPNVFLVRPVF